MLRPGKGGGFCPVCVLSVQKAIFLCFLPDFLSFAGKVLPVRALKKQLFRLS